MSAGTDSERENAREHTPRCFRLGARWLEPRPAAQRPQEVWATLHILIHLLASHRGVHDTDRRRRAKQRGLARHDRRGRVCSGIAGQQEAIEGVGRLVADIADLGSERLEVRLVQRPLKPAEARVSLLQAHARVIRPSRAPGPCMKGATRRTRARGCRAGGLAVVASHARR